MSKMTRLDVWAGGPSDRVPERMGGRRWILVACLPFLSSALGCISYRSGELDERRPWPAAGAKEERKPTIRISMVGRGSFNQKPYLVKSTMVENWFRFTREAYQASGLFSEVRSGGAAADLVADVEVIDDSSGSKFLAVISGITLGIVPCTGSDTFTWKTTFRDSAGNVKGTIEKRESETTWIELLLVFGMPFSSTYEVVHEMFEASVRSSLLDARAKGFLALP